MISEMAKFGELIDTIHVDGDAPGSGRGVDKWDRRFLELAKHVATWSKDPSTKVGAVIVDDDRRVVSLGFNGFARGVRDDPESYANRDLKIAKGLHAEENAILFAKCELKDCTLYTWPFMPCAKCSGSIIQKMLRRVVAPNMPDRLRERWASSMEIAASDFRDAGVELVLVNEG